MMNYLFCPLSPARGSRTARRIVLCFALLLAPCTHAHELTENRATMVLRDSNHVAITLYVKYAEALHQTLAPEQPFSEFVLALSALPAAQFAVQLQTAQTRLQAAIKVTPNPAVDSSLQRWLWPVAAKVQTALRERAMQLLAAPKDHAHDTPLEVRFELRSTARIAALSTQFPQAFGRVLVVSYRPQQTWAEPGQAATAISFE